MNKEIISLHNLPEFRHDHEQHKIPLGALVELDINEAYDIPDHTGIKGKARLIVIEHTRDCDGTPLYILSTNNIAPPLEKSDQALWAYFAGHVFSGYGEQSLTIVGRQHLYTWEQFIKELREYETDN